MKVVYHCYGGSHASPVAAAIHLNSLPEKGIPKTGEILAVPMFDAVPPEFHGTLVHLGTDDEGHEIFVVGARNHSTILLKTLKGVTRIIGEDSEDFLFADVKPCINLYMRIGGFISRSLGLTFLGRPIVTWGVRLSYPKIAALVARTKSRLNQHRSGGS